MGLSDRGIYLHGETLSLFVGVGGGGASDGGKTDTGSKDTLEHSLLVGGGSGEGGREED